MGAPGGVVWPSAWLDGFTVSSPLLRTGSPGNSPVRVTIGAMFFNLTSRTLPAAGNSNCALSHPPGRERRAQMSNPKQVAGSA